MGKERERSKPDNKINPSSKFSDFYGKVDEPGRFHDSLIYNEYSTDDEFEPFPWEDDNRGFEFLPTQMNRVEAMVVASELVLYLEKNDIANLLLVDRAARPAYHAVRAVWNMIHKGESMPFNVYFMNPRGFLTDEDLSRKQNYLGGSRRMNEFAIGMSSDDIAVRNPEGRTESGIKEELHSRRYKQLMKAKDRPTLLYDNCIHDGDSIRPIQKTLKEIGFTDLRIGVASMDRNISEIVPDFVAFENSQIIACAVFGSDRAVQKPFNSITSRVDPYNRAEINKLREELKIAVMKPMTGVCVLPPVKSDEKETLDELLALSRILDATIEAERLEREEKKRHKKRFFNPFR